MTTIDLARSMIAAGWRPLPGRCIIALDSVPTMSGLIHIPESARQIEIKDAVWPGVVLAIRLKEEERRIDNVKAGAHVLLLLRAEDMDRPVIITDNTRIVAEILP
jgi:hypothetical protein